MIANIGVLIAAYVVVRCLQIAGSRDDAYSSKMLAAATRIAAMLALLFAVYCAIELLTSSARLARELPAIER